MIVMKTSSSLTVSNRVHMPLAAIEEYVNIRIKSRNVKIKTRYAHIKPVSKAYENIDCCSAYVQASGMVDIACNDENTGSLKLVSIPVEISYLFTCVKSPGQLYKVAWSCSLS